MADLLTGRVNPSGKLPFTYPKFQDGGGIPYLHSVSDMCTKDPGGTLPHWENVPCDVQWPFGHGLSYTNFEYENLSVSTTTLDYHYEMDEEPSLTISVTVKNTGIFAGAESVLFFTFDQFRSVTPEYKRLRGFEKVWLEPATSTSVSLTIPLDDFRFVGPHDDTHYILQDGLAFQVGVGPDVDCRRPTDETAPLCSPPVVISAGEDYVAACESACNLWKSSGCSDHFKMTRDNCWDMCTSIHQESSGDLQMNNDGW
jgi:beta-glucosidase